MERRNRSRALLPGVVQPGPFCFAMLALALCGLFLLIVRLGEGPGLTQAAAALLMLCAPLLCLRSRGRS